jgi:hypothetical protein
MAGRDDKECRWAIAMEMASDSRDGMSSDDRAERLSRNRPHLSVCPAGVTRHVHLLWTSKIRRPRCIVRSRKRRCRRCGDLSHELALLLAEIRDSSFVRSYTNLCLFSITVDDFGDQDCARAEHIGRCSSQQIHQSRMRDSEKRKYSMKRTSLPTRRSMIVGHRVSNQKVAQ